MIRALLLLSMALPLAAQNSSADAQLTQILINEIRQLRQDLQTTAATIQRVQIVMYRLQAQTTLMARATQRLDEAHRHCTDVQNQRKMMARELNLVEERQRTSQNPQEQKTMEETISRIKGQAEFFANEEQQCQVRESEADTQYRAERAKLSELEDTLEKLDKILAGAK
jgi:hypothetical protein